MGGYFICNGIERIIRMIVLQRRHYIMALHRGAYRKRGSNYTDAATALRSVDALTVQQLLGMKLLLRCSLLYAW